jgi:hypothetical protein
MSYSAPLRTFSCTLLVVIVLTALLSSAEAQQPSALQMKNGIIVMTGFEGDVKIFTTTSDQPIKPTKGAVLKQGHVVVTGANSKASLAFENGIVMEVSPSTKFVIQEFQQAPWDVAPDKLAEMKTEPSKSKTTGFLEYGDVITGVKKLKPESSMDVSTPLGTAGIRGTDFKTSAVRNSDGSPKRFTVGVASGEVGVKSAGSSESVPVPAGTASTVSVTPSQSSQSGNDFPASNKPTLCGSWQHDPFDCVLSACFGAVCLRTGGSWPLHRIAKPLPRTSLPIKKSPRGSLQEWRAGRHRNSKATCE